jgi:pilus assembly protein CpaC
MNATSTRVCAGLSVIPLLALSLATFPERGSAQESPDDLSLTVGKSALVSSDKPIERVSVGFGEVAEATAVSPREVLVNGKAPGSTSLIVWQQGGGKLFYDVNVRPSQFLANNQLEALRRQLLTELPDQQITPAIENGAVFLRGRAKDLTSVDRAVAIASTAGKVVNLLYVDVPPPEAQILLKVRFASVDRNNLSQLALNLFSTGATNTIGAVGTQRFNPPTAPPTSNPNNLTAPFAFSDLLNIFLFRPDLNLGATIKALEQKALLQILAEPNVLTKNGKQGSFLAGGEFPYPVVQGSSLAQTVTIEFREFGVRLNFIPTITPTGMIRLQVAPEVSTLDYANGITLNGFQVPGLISRKVNTEVELQDNQSFAIAGLLDRRVIDTLSKLPFLGDIPILGKLFQSKDTNKQNTELLVIVTPEIVHPIPAGAAVPDLKYPKPFLNSDPVTSLRTPGVAVTGQNPPAPTPSIPVEKLLDSMKPESTLNTAATRVKDQGSMTAQPAAATEIPNGQSLIAPSAAPK